MIFEEGNIYHIYNQGNNRQKIFFDRRDYLYFKDKIERFVLPYSDLLAWCLMPNHFHLMVYVKSVDIQIVNNQYSKWANSRVILRNLNDSIGIMLRSYTRGINKKNDRSGSLFRKETKAICLTAGRDITKNWLSGIGKYRIDNIPEESQYVNVCYNYINTNPIKAGLVFRLEDWEFSSFNELAGFTNHTLINHQRIKELQLCLADEI